VSLAARNSGLIGPIAFNEWANSHTRTLSKAGLIKDSGKSLDGAKIRIITEAGRAALKMPESPHEDKVPRLTKSRMFCLEQLQRSEDGMTGRQISQAAIHKRLTRDRQIFAEWADPHLLWLRKNGYAVHTEAVMDRAKVHKITPAGEEVLKAALAKSEPSDALA
jgi:DNA-binding PadR family transcriptional regulator